MCAWNSHKFPLYIYISFRFYFTLTYSAPWFNCIKRCCYRIFHECRSLLWIAHMLFLSWKNTRSDIFFRHIAEPFLFESTFFCFGKKGLDVCVCVCFSIFFRFFLICFLVTALFESIRCIDRQYISHLLEHEAISSVWTWVGLYYRSHQSSNCRTIEWKGWE